MSIPESICFILFRQARCNVYTFRAMCPYVFITNARCSFPPSLIFVWGAPPHFFESKFQACWRRNWRTAQHSAYTLSYFLPFKSWYVYLFLDPLPLRTRLSYADIPSHVTRSLSRAPEVWDFCRCLYCNICWIEKQNTWRGVNSFQI